MSDDLTLFLIRIIVVPYVFSSPIASSGLPANFLNFPGKGLVSSRRGGGLECINESIMAAVPFFLPLVPLPLFPVSIVCRAAGSLVYVHEAFESAFQIGLMLKKCYSKLSSVSRNIVSHCLKLVQCALIEMLLDTLHGLCFTQSNSKIGKLCKRSYGAH